MTYLAGEHIPLSDGTVVYVIVGHSDAVIGVAEDHQVYIDWQVGTDGVTSIGYFDDVHVPTEDEAENWTDDAWDLWGEIARRTLAGYNLLGGA